MKVPALIISRTPPYPITRLHTIMNTLGKKQVIPKKQAPQNKTSTTLISYSYQIQKNTKDHEILIHGIPYLSTIYIYN
jgi:hypothetical protein